MAQAQDRGWTPARSVAGGRNPWSVVGVVSLATLMVVLDTTIVNVALAHIAGSLSASYEEATWVVTSYLIANAVVIPVSGWLADVIGRKRYYMISVALFTASSVLCALSPNLTTLIIMRVLQGVGGGGLAPVEQSMLADTFPPSKRGLAFAAYGLVVVTGPIVGPILGGWITDQYSWHWCFLINLPVGLASLLLVSIFVDEPKPMREQTAKLRAEGLRIDYIGFAFSALLFACLEVTIDRGQTDDWFASPVITVAAIVGALSLLALIPWELMQDRPIMNLHLFRQRNFAISSVLLLVVGVVLFGTTQFIPQLLQEVLGYTATTAGLALTAGGVVTILGMPLVGVLTSRVDVRYLIGFGFLMQVLAFSAMSHFSTEMAFYNAAYVRAIQAAGLPFLFIPVSTVAYVGLRPEENNQASALMNVVRNLGGSIGIATVQIMLSRGQQIHQSQLVDGLSPLNPNYVRALSHLTQALTGHAATGTTAAANAPALGILYRQVQEQAAMLSYLAAFRFLMIVAICAMPLIFLMRKGHGGAGGGEGAV
ncbi:MAG TPA: DHA2 family efflux MFS transporter permease subunit [Steroidobacteraceae bacterium]|nr:DHA2 family efflux MFS transporter permease subunit [Steroidobacteraceae bacterium]